MADDFFSDLTPEQAFDIGEATGKYLREQELIKAYEMGEIDQYIEFITPKTWEDWEAWHEEHEEGFANRWKV